MAVKLKGRDLRICGQDVVQGTLCDQEEVSLNKSPVIANIESNILGNVTESGSGGPVVILVLPNSKSVVRPWILVRPCNLCKST